MQATEHHASWKRNEDVGMLQCCDLKNILKKQGSFVLRVKYKYINNKQRIQLKRQANLAGGGGNICNV